MRPASGFTYNNGLASILVTFLDLLFAEVALVFFVGFFSFHNLLVVRRVTPHVVYTE